MNNSNKRIEFYSTRGEWGFLSNFHRCPIFFDMRHWISSEHIYQAMKFDNRELQEIIRSTTNLYDVVSIGRDPLNAPRMRADWNEIKVDVMIDILMHKFTQNLALRVKLLSTEDAIIVETSPKDYFWGEGADGTGLNMLGKALMDVREQLR